MQGIHHDHPQTKDINIYQYILQRSHAQFTQIRPLDAATTVLTHILFKVIVIMLFYFEQIFNELLTPLTTSQLSIVFVVVDFWFTKNINARKMLGLRWFFGEDQFGVQRFKYEVRVNEEYVSGVNKKLFWIMQIAYITVPVIDMITNFIMVPNIYLLNLQKIFINLIVISGGLSNFFLFYKASAASTDKIYQLKLKFGHDFLRKLGPNSLVSYL